MGMAWLGLRVNRPGPIEAFLPVMLFAHSLRLVHGYQVFLVTRIHEEWIKSGDNSVAVRNGLAATGKTITAAALIMILVFGSFILGGERVIKEFGLGLAGGILVDAVVIRMAVVPSVMLLIGKTNWWFPKSLDRILPHIGLEQAEAGPESTGGIEGAQGKPGAVNGVPVIERRLPLPLVHHPDEPSTLLARSFGLVVLGPPPSGNRAGPAPPRWQDWRRRSGSPCGGCRHGQAGVGEGARRRRGDAASGVIGVDPVADLEAPGPIRRWSPRAPTSRPLDTKMPYP